MPHPCYNNECRLTCQYGSRFYECPYWQAWAAEYSAGQQEEDETDDDW